jgi:hypothetical protein
MIAHFGDGRTGSSTVRRSIAALLAAALGLEGIPRKPRPARAPRELWAGREPRAQAWRLDGAAPLACYLAEAYRPQELLAVERVVLERLRPPLNLQDNESEWKPDVLAARRRMANQARAWIVART